jgi:hypothetical protein
MSEIRMRPRLALFAFSFSGLLLASASVAARNPPVVTPLVPGAVITPVNVNGVDEVTGTCVIGVTDAPVYVVDYLTPPADQYFTQLYPWSCPCPTPDSLYVKSAHVLLSFPILCSMTVTVSIVGATLAGTCYRPDPNKVIVPPNDYELTASVVGASDFSMPLPAGYCITGPTFLEFTVNSFSGCPNMPPHVFPQPSLVTTGSCVPCRSWNFYPAGHEIELCDVGFPGNPIMYVQGDCCTSTPVRGGSWGRLKTIYR